MSVANLVSTKPRVFLDTSALFAGIWSATGGARMILKLGEAGAVHILLSSQVLEEIEDVLRRKAPDQLPGLALLLDRAMVEVVNPASAELKQRCLEIIRHSGDAQILADAWESRCSFLATLDANHFLENTIIRESIPFPVGTPGDFLAWYRRYLSEF